MTTELILLWLLPLATFPAVLSDGRDFYSIEMATRGKSMCRHSGCRGLVDVAGYCEAHKKDSTGWYATSTKTTTARGYGWDWQKTRTRILKRDKGLCQPCLKNDRCAVAKDVDHIVSKEHGGTDDDTNLQAICRDCHKAKTASERRGGSILSRPETPDR